MRANLALLAAVLLAPLPALAHHSFAAVFDSNQQLVLEGEVTKVEWANPHIWVYLDVADDQGEVVNWQCEGGTPNSLRRLGWSSETLQEGDTIQIEGWRAHDGTETCNARALTKDGRRLFAGSSFEEQ
jgi:hypothetical protein